MKLEYFTKADTVQETWRWKMIRKVADYINNPDDITMSELKAMIENYRSCYNIKQHVEKNQTHHY